MIIKVVLFLAFLLHLGFAVGELFPWDPPLLLARVTDKMNNGKPDDQKVLSSPTDRKLVSIIVHNAGIYNLIMAAGFLWALIPSVFGNALNEQATNAVRIFFFFGATVAGLFGLTLSSLTAIQAAVGLVGILCVYIDRRKGIS